MYLVEIVDFGFSIPVFLGKLGLMNIYGYKGHFRCPIVSGVTIIQGDIKETIRVLKQGCQLRSITAIVVTSWLVS